MTAPPAKFISKPEGSNRWLILIAAFKLAQALLFHKDVGDELARLAHHLRFNPESRFVDFIVEKASILDDRLLKRIGTLVFIYAGLDMIEGIGLYLEKAWAEYFTLILTASFLPWEVFEIFRRLTVPRVALFTVNAMVLVYLLKLVIERGRLRVGQAGDPGV